MGIRVGMIGAGWLGSAHLENLTTFPEVEIAAVCDSDRTRAEEAASRYGGVVHINFRTMIEAERLDALFICLPPFARGEPESLAASAGIHLFIEKPVALSFERAMQVQKEIEKADVVTAVGYCWRYLSGIDRAKELLADRKIALVRGRRFGPVPPLGWRRKRESSGGWFVQEATELIDIARWLAGEITTVAGFEYQGIAAARTDDYDIEDAMTVAARFRNGAVGEFVSCNVGMRDETALSVIADGIELRLDADSLEILERGKQTRIEHLGSSLRSAQEAFLEAVKSGSMQNIRSNYADAVRTLHAVLSFAASAEGGKPIYL